MAIITVSRQFGSGGEYVCERVASKLGFRFVHKEIVRYIAILCGTNEDKVHQFDEESHSTLRSVMSKYFDFDIFDDIFKYNPKDYKEAQKAVFKDEWESFFDQYESTEPVFDSTTFQSMMERIISKLADDTNLVMMGRGGQFIMKNYPNALHVRLVAPVADRAFWLKNRENLTDAQAVEKIKQIDTRKRKFIKHYYNGDIDSNDNYHATLNVKMFDIEETAQAIADMAKMKFKL